jgi:hypothetical protein
VTRLSTSNEIRPGYAQHRAFVKELPGDAGQYEDLCQKDKPAHALTRVTPNLAPIRLVFMYDLRAKYESARERDDPLLSPHGFFRSLQFGNRRHALEFTSTFGPLTWKPQVIAKGADLYTRLNLAEFWAKHRRYCRVAALIENHSRPAELRDTLSTLQKEIALLDVADSFPLSLPRPFHRASRRQLGTNRAEFDKWLGSATDDDLRSLAESVIHRELVRQLHTRKPWWIRKQPELRFELTLLSGTLWNILWEMLAWDTSSGIFWRICPHCGKLFYPPRRDRFYCTSRQQVLASKRQYAAEQRATSKRHAFRRFS